MKTKLICALGWLSVLAACAVAPTGPSVMALPGHDKTFDAFKQDDGECRGWAFQQSGAQSANASATTSVAGIAAIGTALGAAVGAAFDGGHGAALGAGAGLLGGALVGTHSAQSSASSVQGRYDAAYMQCMYAKGEKVALPSNMAEALQPQPPAPMAPPRAFPF